jgi:DNA-binding NarL/FixJ family response regulator
VTHVDGSVYISLAVPPLRIVLVDDEPMFLELMRERLRNRHDLELVGVATNGIDGIDLVRELRPDAAVIDVFMPQMNGFEVTRRLRDEMPLLQVLLISADGDPAHHAAARRAGAETFVDKRDVTPAMLLRHLGGTRV